MKHPTREEWMAYLYREVPDTERAAMREHLDACSECQKQMKPFAAATSALDEWKLPARATRVRVPFVRWAAAAAVAVLAMLGVGQVLSLRAEVKALRAELARTTQFPQPESSALAALDQQWEQKRAADQQAFVAALHKLAAQQTRDYASLRKEIETVAVFSEAGLVRAQSQISSLAAVPSNFTDSK